MVLYTFGTDLDGVVRGGGGKRGVGGAVGRRDSWAVIFVRNFL